MDTARSTDIHLEEGQMPGERIMAEQALELEEIHATGRGGAAATLGYFVLPAILRQSGHAAPSFID